MDYAALQSSIADWLLRADLTAQIRTFISLAEARMNRDSRLRVREGITRGTISVTSLFVPLPSDFARMINIEDENGRPLEYRSPQELDRVRSTGATGRPLFYSVIGSDLEVVPEQTACDLSAIYFRKIPALSDSVTTNWLLDVAPDLYLYASLVESAPFLKDDERVALWDALYSNRCMDFAKSSEEDQYAGSPLIVSSGAIG